MRANRMRQDRQPQGTDEPEEMVMVLYLDWSKSCTTGHMVKVGSELAQVARENQGWIPYDHDLYPERSMRGCRLGEGVPPGLAFSEGE